MKSKKLNRAKRTKRTKKNKNNMKGGVVCVINVLVQENPKEIIIINLNDNDSYESFMKKLNDECLNKYNVYLSKLYSRKDSSRIEINKDNFQEYCDKEIIAITINNFIKNGSIDFLAFKKNMDQDKDVCQNISYLSALKPVATFTSSYSTCILGGDSVKNVFKFYWNIFNDDDKETIKKHFKICNRFKGGKAMQVKPPTLDIYVNPNSDDVIFYSPEHFNYLCELFGYKLQEGFDTINGKMESFKERLFIYLAFGDLLHPEIIKSTNQIEPYEKIKTESILVLGGEKTCQQVVDEYKEKYKIQ